MENLNNFLGFLFVLKNHFCGRRTSFARLF